MISISFNGRDEDIASADALGLAFGRYERHAQFELWLSVSEGPSLCMLRNGEHAFLMYLRWPGDSGFVSVGQITDEALVRYTLSNGQVDEYPRSWCVPVEKCFKALADFFVNDGRRPEGIAWHEPV